MKSNNMFREQVNTVTTWFNSWSECEKTVALYSLLKQIPPLQCRFLVQVLQQKLSENKEVLKQEEEANDPAFICQLSVAPKEKIISQLLSHLPLLHSGNPQAKTEYLKLISAILTHSIEHGVYIEESRQLLSYSLIHPAITSDERSNFNKWLTQLNERFSSVYHQGTGQGYSEEIQGQSYSHQGERTHPPVGRQVGSRANGFHGVYGQSESQLRNGVDLQGGGQNNVFFSQDCMPPPPVQNSRLLSPSTGHPPLHSTHSAPPNFTTVVPSSSSSVTQQHGINTHAPLARVPSLPFHITSVKDWLESNHQQAEHAPLSPQSSTASSGSGSDTRQDDCISQPGRNTFMEEDSGMRDVPLWLKGLRLHKYAVLFQEMAYEDMFNLTEEWLEQKNVTKGARHKIILSINKLKERQNVLRDLEKDITEGGDLKNCITEMKTLLNTPIKPFNPTADSKCTTNSPASQPVTQGKADGIQEGDLPSQFTSLMAKVCSQLLTSPYDDECFNMYLQLIDKCINHEAFSQKQKKLLDSWKQQARRIWQPAPFKYGFDKKTRPNWGNTYPLGGSFTNRQIQRPGPRCPQKPSGMQWSFGAKRSVIGGTMSSTGHIPLHRNNSLNTAIFSRPSVMEQQQTKQPVTRTQSAPLRSQQQLGFGAQAVESSTDTEINARLDSLCRSVTEHALGTSDGNEKGSGF